MERDADLKMEETKSLSTSKKSNSGEIPRSESHSSSSKTTPRENRANFEETHRFPMKRVVLKTGPLDESDGERPLEAKVNT